jgi:hypothetical protein
LQGRLKYLRQGQDAETLLRRDFPEYIMKRETGKRNILDRLAKDFVSVIEKFSEYIIVSGFVAISHGRTRGTEDIDIIIRRVPKEKFTQMHNSLTKAGFECMQSGNPEEIYEYLEGNNSVRYTRKDRRIPEIELKFARDELDEYQLRTKKKLPLSGLDLWFSSIEMNIAFKEELLKSPKDMDDAKHLRIIYSEKISEKEIDKIKRMIMRFRLSGKR